MSDNYNISIGPSAYHRLESTNAWLISHDSGQGVSDLPTSSNKLNLLIQLRGNILNCTVDLTLSASQLNSPLAVLWQSGPDPTLNTEGKGLSSLFLRMVTSFQLLQETRQSVDDVTAKQTSPNKAFAVHLCTYVVPLSSQQL
jgi:hypothetical protein